MLKLTAEFAADELRKTHTKAKNDSRNWCCTNRASFTVALFKYLMGKLVPTSEQLSYSIYTGLMLYRSCHPTIKAAAVLLLHYRKLLE
jgi:hypothetical protein